MSSDAGKNIASLRYEEKASASANNKVITIKKGLSFGKPAGSRKKLQHASSLHKEYLV